MEAFRNMVRGWLGKTLLALLMVPFALVGIESYFSNNGKDIAATVNGTDIVQRVVDQEAEQQKERILARFGKDVDPNIVDIKAIRKSVLDNLVNQELLSQHAQKVGFLLSDATINRLIAEQPAFQENGKFDEQRYKTLLSQNGLDPLTYPSALRKQLMTTLLNTSLTQSSFATNYEVDHASMLQKQRRDIHSAIIPSAKFLANVSVSDAEVKKFYEENQSRYKVPETVSVNYIRLEKSEFVNKAHVSEDDIQQRYEDRLKDLKGKEQRQAQHILITVDDKQKDADALAKIKSIQDKLKAGTDFSQLAKEFSQDPGSVAKGGDLGAMTRGNFVAEFDKVLFSLKEGETSAPVKTQFGYHLIKLNKVIPEPVPSLASLKPSLEIELKEAKVVELFNETVEKVDAAAYEASDLKDLASKFNKSIVMTEPFTRDSGLGYAATAKVREVAFSDDLIHDGKNSSSITLSDGSVLWIHIAKHTPSSVKPLDVVASDAKNQLLIDKAREKSKAVALEIVKALQTNALDVVAKQYDLAWQTVTNATRTSTVPNQTIIQAAFRLPRPAINKVSADIALADSSYAVVAITQVYEGDPASQSEKVQFKSALGELRSSQEMQDYLQYLKANGKVTLKVEKSAVE
jgi:peptidyl-prolyl cis-trans isomerase D